MIKKKNKINFKINFKNSINKNNEKNLNNLPPMISFNGKNYDVLNGLYIDSSKDKYDNSKSGFKNDKVISYSKCKRNNWYENRVLDYSVDTSKFGGKELFLKKNRSVLASYKLSYNLWNSYKGWEFGDGKFEPLNGFNNSYTGFELTGSNNDTLYDWQEFTDSFHDSNERVQIGFQEEWKDNVLNIYIIYKARVHWAKGSLIKHAALIRTTEMKYSFIQEDKTYSARVAKGEVSFTTNGTGTSIIDLKDYETRVKASAAKNILNGFTIPMNAMFNCLGSNSNTEAVLIIGMDASDPFMKDTMNVLYGSGHMGTLSIIIKGDVLNIKYSGPSGESEGQPQVGGFLKETIWWDATYFMTYMAVKK